MKQAFLILSVAALMFSLSSCSTYVDGTGYVEARPGYYHRTPAPRPHPHYYSGTRHNDNRHYHPSYYKAKPVPPGHYRRSGVNTRTNANVGLRLF